MPALKRKKDAILVVTENLNVGGAEKYTVLIANELQKRGYRVIVLANDGPFRGEFNPSVRFVRAHFECGLPGLLYGIFQIIRISIMERVSLVHAQKLESSSAAWVARFVTRVPVVKTAHGYTRKELLSVGKKINRYADRVIAVVDWIGEELEKNGVAPHKLSLIYNGMTPPGTALSAGERSALRQRLAIGEDDTVIVSVSRLERGKNHAEFIDWFPRILKEAPDAKYLIVGNGPEKERLVQKVKALNLEASVLFVAGTVHAEPYLQIADIFCTPAVAQGMAVLEAMASGLPVVGTRPSSGPEVVVDGETGYIVTKHDGDAFVARLTELAHNPAVRERMGAAGKVRQEMLFTIEKTVDGIEVVYAPFLS